jgi:hypothetical protein
VAIQAVGCARWGSSGTVQGRNTGGLRTSDLKKESRQLGFPKGPSALSLVLTSQLL